MEPLELKQAARDRPDPPDTVNHVRRDRRPDLGYLAAQVCRRSCSVWSPYGPTGYVNEQCTRPFCVAGTRQATRPFPADDARKGPMTSLRTDLSYLWVSGFGEHVLAAPSVMHYPRRSALSSRL
jgi:hypothetical protein